MKFLSLFPFLLCEVTGTSMLPTLLPNERIIVQRKYFFCNIQQNDIIALHDPRTKKLIVKRVKEVKNKQFFVTGDNLAESTDSRTFGWVEEKSIVGKVIYQINL